MTTHNADAITHRTMVETENTPSGQQLRAVCSCGWRAKRTDVNPNTAWPRARMHERRAAPLWERTE